MSIASELTRLQNAKAAIKQSLENKGATIDSSATLSDYPSIIDNLPSGGDNSVLKDLIERDITSIEIPEGTTQIGHSAFLECQNLQEITIPNTVTIIQDAAFYLCGVRNPIIPSSVTRINGNPFRSSGLYNIVIPETVKSFIYTYAFQGCSYLQTAVINDTNPASVNGVDICNHMFQGCTALTSVSFNHNILSIGNRAFQNCTSLPSFTIPSTVTNIQASAFYGCTSLTEIIVEATTPPTLASGAFDNTNNCPIYVPCESVQAYKTATNWSTYADRITCEGGETVNVELTGYESSYTIPYDTQNYAYWLPNIQITATLDNGKEPTNPQWSSSDLESNLGSDGNTCELSGMLMNETTGTRQVTVTFTCDEGTATANFNLVVQDMPSLQITATPSVNQATGEYTITATSNYSGCDWTCSGLSDITETGKSYSSTYTVSGTLTQAGTYTATINCTNEIGTQATTTAELVWEGSTQIGLEVTTESDTINMTRYSMYECEGKFKIKSATLGSTQIDVSNISVRYIDVDTGFDITNISDGEVTFGYYNHLDERYEEITEAQIKFTTTYNGTEYSTTKTFTINWD